MGLHKVRESLVQVKVTKRQSFDAVVIVVAVIT